MDSSQLASLSFWQKVGIFAFAPQALCLAAFAACLHAYDGDRLSAAVIAMAAVIAPFTLHALLLGIFGPGAAQASPRMNAFAAMTASAMTVGLAALTLDFGYALVEVLRERNGHYVLGGALAAAFFVAVLAFSGFLTRSAYGFSPTYATILVLCNACIIAFSAYAGSVGFCLTLAADAALILAVIFFTIPRGKPKQAPSP